MSLVSLFPAFIIISVIAVIALTDVMKSLDKNNHLKGWRIWIPAVLSGGIATLLGYGRFFDWHQVFFWWAVIFALAVFLYEAAVKRLHEWINSKQITGNT